MITRGRWFAGLVVNILRGSRWAAGLGLDRIHHHTCSILILTNWSSWARMYARITMSGLVVSPLVGEGTKQEKVKPKSNKICAIIDAMASHGIQYRPKYKKESASTTARLANNNIVVFSKHRHLRTPSTDHAGVLQKTYMSSSTVHTPMTSPRMTASRRLRVLIIESRLLIPGIAPVRTEEPRSPVGNDSRKYMQ